MKKAAAGILAIMLMVCIGFAAANAGSASDPLVSKDYVDNTFKENVMKSSETAIDKALNSEYNDAVERLKQTPLGNTEYYQFAGGYESVEVKAGKAVRVYMGGTLILTKGAATVGKEQGKVINVSTGAVASSGEALSTDQRYFSAENTVAVYTMTANSTCLINGFYRIVDGKDALPESGPSLREFGPYIFNDVPEYKWFYKAIGYVYRHNIFNGVETNRFGVNENIKRADFVTVLYRMAGSPSVSGTSKFPDVSKKSSYYYNAVVWASQNGIVVGYDTGMFGPTDSVTREQIMTFMFRYAKYSGMNMNVKDPNRINTFPDKGEVSGWASKAVAWAIGNGIINGTDGKIDPRGTAIRCQIAQIIYNFCTVYQ